MDCKPGDQPLHKNGEDWKLSSSESYQVGEMVEYWSTSAGRWVAAKVLKVKVGDGQCDLDLKPGAQLGRLRKASTLRPGLADSTPAMWPMAGTKNSSVAPPPPLSCGFKDGDQVQYWSETKSRWLEAVVQRIREKDGVIVYDLDCKKGTPADRVRPSLVASQKQYQVGEEVEYWSTSAGRWLPAKVLRLYEHLSQCDLDVKPGAPVGRMRRVVRSATPGGAPADGALISPTSSRETASHETMRTTNHGVPQIACNGPLPCTKMPQAAATNGTKEDQVFQAAESKVAVDKMPLCSQPACVGEWCSGEKMMRIVESGGRLVVDMGPLTPTLALVALTTDEQGWPRRWSATRKNSGTRPPEGSRALYILELPSPSSHKLLVKRPVGDGQVEFVRTCAQLIPPQSPPDGTTRNSDAPSHRPERSRSPRRQ